MANTSIITEIENEYRKINDRWLKLHFSTAVGLVFFGFIVECILEPALYTTGDVVIPVSMYLIRYLVAPLAANIVCSLTGYWAIRSSLLKQKTKEYVVSLIFVLICFVFYTVHIVFPALFLIFTTPILLTTVYGDYVLTSVTAATSFSAKILSDVLIVWDPEKADPFATGTSTINFVISICILAAFLVVCVVVMHFEQEKNSASIQKEMERYHLQQKIMTDELTEIGNRTALRKAFQLMEVDNEGTTYTFVMIDLDNFKALNDTLGHDQGDDYLKDFAKILKQNCVGGQPFRFGGDEFCILFQGQPLESVIETCEKIQQNLKEVVNDSAPRIPLTASFGIAQFDHEMPTSQLVRNSDAALYHSKSVKNAIYVYNEKDDTYSIWQKGPDHE